MPIIIKYNVIRFQVSVNNISLMQILQCKQNFSSIKSCSILIKASFMSNDLSKITSWAEVKNQE